MKSFFLTFALFFVPIIGLTQDAPPFNVASLPKSVADQTICLNPNYLVYLPKTAADEKLPLLIYLHGGGGIGTEVKKIRGQAAQLVRGIEQHKYAPCIVVAPQVLPESKDDQRRCWNAHDLNLWLQHLKDSLPVDTNRIYLTGNSMGGYGSWMWGGHNPEHFAAIAPVVGGIGRGGPKDVTPDLKDWAANLAKVPVYAFAGGKDKVVPAERSERMIAAIKTAGGKLANINVLQDEGHNAGRKVFTSKQYYDWMFSKKRTP